MNSVKYITETFMANSLPAMKMHKTVFQILAEALTNVQKDKFAVVLNV